MNTFFYSSPFCATTFFNGFHGEQFVLRFLRGGKVPMVEPMVLSRKIGLFWMKLIKGGTRRTSVTHQAKMSEDIGTFVLVALLNW